MNHISVVDELVEGVNNLDAGATHYDQVWGSSVPRSVGMNTLVTMGSAYFRIKVTDVDSYLIAAIPTSGKTITFGTTSVELIGSRPATTSQINRLVVYGAYATDVDGAATDGVLQYTPPEDTDDQLLHGVVALYLRRNDILSFAALKAFADELWVHRKVISSIPKIFTLRIASNVWVDAGDTVDITNGQQVDDYLVDGTYIILSADIDLYREEKIIEVSTVISSEFHDYNDSLPILSQMPISTTDSTQGAAITPTSLTELIGKEPAWTKDEIILYNQAGTTLTSGGSTDIPWTETTDTNSSFSTPTFTAKYAGMYMVDASLFLEEHTYVAGDRLVFSLVVDGDPYISAEREIEYAALEYYTSQLHTMIKCAVGTTIKLSFYNGHGSNLTLLNVYKYNRCSIVRIY
jgi:hypothetical protein